MAVTTVSQAQHLLTRCITLSRLLYLLTPQSPWLCNGDKNRLHLGKSKRLAGYPTPSKLQGVFCQCHLIPSHKPDCSRGTRERTRAPGTVLTPLESRSQANAEK